MHQYNCCLIEVVVTHNAGQIASLKASNFELIFNEFLKVSLLSIYIIQLYDLRRSF